MLCYICYSLKEDELPNSCSEIDCEVSQRTSNDALFYRPTEWCSQACWTLSNKYVLFLICVKNRS
jgi:hypothetical protein